MIGLLKYRQGFTLSQLIELLEKETEDSFNMINNEEQKIAMQLEALKINQLYLSPLFIHPDDVARIPIEVLSNIPLKIDEETGPGFSVEMIHWLRENVSLQTPTTPLYIQKKYGNDHLGIILFEEKQENNHEFKMGRGSHQHIDLRMMKLEISIDDMNPEFYGFIFEELFRLGANDVYVEQVIMKKNRPASVLHVLCQEEKKEEIISFLFRETTTLGVRYTPYSVYRLEREFIPISTPWGEATIKIGKMHGKVVQIAPEYDQCVAIAKEKNLPLKLIYDTIKQLGYQSLE